MIPVNLPLYLAGHCIEETPTFSAHDPALSALLLDEPCSLHLLEKGPDYVTPRLLKVSGLRAVTFPAAIYLPEMGDAYRALGVKLSHHGSGPDVPPVRVQWGPFYMGPGLNIGGPLRGGNLLNIALHIIGEPRDEGVHWHVIGGGHINITFLMHSIGWGTDIYI